MLYGRVVRLLNMDWPANYRVMLVPVPMFGRMGKTSHSLTAMICLRYGSKPQLSGSTVSLMDREE
jgi:hypothetical protein